jgi:energy-converting hydrogenase Eha subunit G
MRTRNTPAGIWRGWARFLRNDATDGVVYLLLGRTGVTWALWIAGSSGVFTRWVVDLRGDLLLQQKM